MAKRVNLPRSLHSTTAKPEIPVSVAADLCGSNRISIYYSGQSVSDTELECKKIIDHLHTNCIKKYDLMHMVITLPN